MSIEYKRTLFLDVTVGIFICFNFAAIYEPACLLFIPFPIINVQKFIFRTQQLNFEKLMTNLYFDYQFVFFLFFFPLKYKLITKIPNR